MKTIEADAPTVRMDCYPNQTKWCPISAIPPYSVHVWCVTPTDKWPVYWPLIYVHNTPRAH